MSDTKRKLAAVAIGGNSLITAKDKADVKYQWDAVKETCKHLVSMVEQGWDIVVTHGNGPQVGFILRRSELAAHEVHTVPLDVIGADTQGSIGYMLQQSLMNEFKRRGLVKNAASIVTQVLVDANDPGFKNPTKGIGGYLDGHIFALNPENGAAVWTFDTGGPIVGAPAVAELNGAPVVYVASADARVYVLNTEDGSRAVAPAIIESEFTSRFLFFPTGTSVRPVPLYAPPILFGDLLIVSSHQGSHLLYALDRETLLDRWQFDAASS